MKIKKLIERLKYTLIQGDLEQEITGFSHDNRSVEPGDLFICIQGARFDTHNCVEEVAEKGARLIVAEREVPLPPGVTVIQVEDTRKASPILAAAYYDHPAEKMTVIGVTGSKGKTTCTHMLAGILRAAGHTAATLGTNGAIIRDKVYELSNTTPDAQEVQMYLDMMVRAGCTHAIVEVSSQGMKQHRVDGFTFDYGIWTNISEGDHIGPNEHKDFEEYLYCKAMLIEHSKLGFINKDDVHAEALMKYITTPVEYYGYDKDADYVISDYQKIFDEEKKEPGISFKMNGKANGEFYVNLPGTFNVGNAAAAICVASHLNISEEEINKALGNTNIKGRIDMVYRSDRFSVCVDFAHNGYSTRNLLEALRDYRPKRIVCVFGADGNRSKSRRYEMGEASGRLADLSIVTAGHNRWEKFEDIARDIHEGLAKTTGSYIVIPDRKEAIRYAIEHAEEGDMITIIGLGHESYQEENGVKYPYSDTEYVKQVVSKIAEKIDGEK